LHNIKRYKYYFHQLDKPIVIEAESRKVADSLLINMNQKMGGWMNIKDLLDLRVETLVIGSSFKIKNKNKLIWVGTKYTSDGWMSEQEYLKIVIKNKKQ